MTQLTNHKGVCRTAPATPGLIITEVGEVSATSVGSCIREVL